MDSNISIMSRHLRKHFKSTPSRKKNLFSHCIAGFSSKPDSQPTFFPSEKHHCYLKKFLQILKICLRPAPEGSPEDYSITALDV